MNDLKLVFAGSPGAGKSTAIRTISDQPPVSTEVPASDEDRTTTVALDFGEIELDDECVVRLYGVPGQGRFDFIWPLIADGAIGVLFFLDMRDPEPLKTLDAYLDSFSGFLPGRHSFLALTHADEAPRRPRLERVVEHLRERGTPMPVMEMDPRQKHEVLYLLNAMIAMLEHQGEAAHAN
ncbi:MAG: ATP/GTP-binding protein [Pseudoxanthomonas suwonensis]|nr:ATP/GTP-binding protein [Pseudoxanthomonas suwonensis]